MRLRSCSLSTWPSETFLFLHHSSTKSNSRLEGIQVKDLIIMTSAAGYIFRSSNRRNFTSLVSSVQQRGISEAQRCRARFEYSPSTLRGLRKPLETNGFHIEQSIFRRLRECRILKPFRSCRGGKAAKLSRQANSLIQPVVPTARQISIPTSSRTVLASRNVTPVCHTPITRPQTITKEYRPSVALANMMSLSPNIDEPRCSVDTHKPDLVSLTETWVYDDKECGNHPHIPGFNLLLKNRTSGVHGGAGLYINNSIKYKALTDFYHPEFEGLWAHLRPTRLPMGYPCIVFGTVYHTYHPAGASDGAMLDYLATSLTTIEGRYPGCGILITGDFNRLNITCFLAQFKLKQLVRVPTRIERTLDLIITNMTQLYDKDLVKTFSPTGLSDHSVVLLQPKPRSARSTSSCRLSTRRDTRPSRKCEFGRYLGSVDWSTLDSAPDCDSKLQMFNELVKIGLDTIMPLKTYKLHHNDAPWVTAEFKL